MNSLFQGPAQCQNEVFCFETRCQARTVNQFFSSLEQVGSRAQTDHGNVCKISGGLADPVIRATTIPLKTLKELCRKLGLTSSGGKDKVLRRPRNQREYLERQMASDIARQLYQEQARSPELPRAPTLPSARQQELHEVTHQPFQPWCQACLMGRSRQSPHERKEEDPKPDGPIDRKPVIQIDYCYTFTSEKGQERDAPQPADDQDQGPEATPDGDWPKSKEDPEKLDTKDQFGCSLVAAESTTGWICVVPVLAKGSASLKRATEALVRMSMMVAGSEPVIIQGDPEPSIKQLLNSFEACRVRLGLGVVQREAPRGSHASNGVAEKAVSTIRRHALTLKAHLESRIKAKVGGHTHVFAWLLRHSGFLHNRYFATNKGLPPFEVVNSKKYVGKLLPFGESCVFFAGSKYKGDLQWQRGVWVGVNERSNSHVILTPDGARESRSVRRLPAEQQWSAEAVLGCRGLPWDYGGKGRRKKAMYTQERTALLPDSATLEQLAKAAGKAAAETIAAATPIPPQAPGRDEAGSDPSSSSSSSSSSGGSSPGGDRQGGEAREGNPRTEPQDRPAGEPQREVRGDEARGSNPNAEPQERPAGETPQHSAMDVSDKPSRPSESHVSDASPKRPRLLLDRPRGGGSASEAGGSPAPSLYPPGFAGVRYVRGDVEAAEEAHWGEWIEEVGNTLMQEEELYELETEYDLDGDRPPELTPEELEKVDFESDIKELTRLEKMGVLRRVRPDEDVSGHSFLTTKVVRDWRKRPGWTRRSRLVAREYRSWSAWSQELFAPASTLATINSLIAVAMAEGLEVVSIDVKDATI